MEVKKMKFDCLLFAVILFLLLSCQSSYRFQRDTLSNSPIAVFGAVNIISEKNEKVIIYSAVDLIKIFEIDPITKKPIGVILPNVVDSGREKTNLVSLSRYSTGVYFARLDLEVGKYYAVVQLGQYSSGQYDQGNGFQTTHLESNIKKMNLGKSFEILPICPDRNGIQLFGVIGVDSKSDELYNVMNLNEKLSEKNRRYLYGVHPNTHEGAALHVESLLEKMVID
jgi:hypothetical protein